MTIEEEVKMSEIERKGLQKCPERIIRRIMWILFWVGVVLMIFVLFYHVLVYYPHNLEERHADWPGGYHPTYNAVKIDEFVMVGVALIALFFVILAVILKSPLGKLDERRKNEK